MKLQTFKEKYQRAYIHICNKNDDITDELKKRIKYLHNELKIYNYSLFGLFSSLRQEKTFISIYNKYQIDNGTDINIYTLEELEIDYSNLIKHLLGVL